MSYSIINKSLKKTIGEEVAAGRVTKKTFDDLSIYCYSRSTEYDNLWNEFNTATRGMVLDPEGNIVTGCMPKFFNFGQLDPSLQKSIIKETDFTVHEKLDGSMINVSKYEGDIVVTSKNSFVSEQAIKAKEMLHKKYKDPDFNSGYTYVFEIIYPENRIVVDYGKTEEMFLLTIINNKTLQDIEDEKIDLYADKFGFKRPQKYYYDSIQGLLREQARPDFNNAEGFVVQLKNGYRFKIKYNEYFKLHHIMTDFSVKKVVEYLMNGNSVVEFVKDYNVPDEFLEDVKATEKGIKELYYRIEQDNLEVLKIVKHLADRKEQAMKLMEIEGKDSVSDFEKGIVFLMLDGKDYSSVIWKRILKEVKKDD